MILQDCHGIRKTGNLEVQFSRQAKHGEFAQKYKKLNMGLHRESNTNTGKCYIGIDLDLSKPKGMPLDLKLHTYSFTTKYINMAKA